MGNNGSTRAPGGHDPASGSSNGQGVSARLAWTTEGSAAAAASSSPPENHRGSRSPFLSAPQVPVDSVQRSFDTSSSGSNQLWRNNSHGHSDTSAQKGIPMLIAWNYGGKEVSVEGSWNNWTSRKALHKSGKDHSVLIVLPSGVYYYKFIVDGESRYSPDLPFVPDENGQIANILDVNGIVPENTEGVEEFLSPPSPFTSYSHLFPEEEEFGKEPPTLPPQLPLNSLGGHNADSSDLTRPQHVVLDHLYVEKGWVARSVIALGLTHRYRSKYVTVVLYKPLQR